MAVRDRNAELEEAVSTMKTEEQGSSRDRCGSIPENGLAPYQKTGVAPYQKTGVAPYQKARLAPYQKTRLAPYQKTVWLRSRRRPHKLCGGVGHPVEHRCMRQVSSRRRTTLEPILRKKESQEEENVSSRSRKVRSEFARTVGSEYFRDKQVVNTLVSFA